MSTYKDAVRRLQVIYNNCAPKAQEAKNQQANYDDFTRMKKKLHVEVQGVRQVNFLEWLQQRLSMNQLRLINTKKLAVERP
jgi:hypothetical protein